MVKNLLAKFKVFWASLPHQVQAAIVALVMAFLAAILHAIESGGCLSWVCVKSYLVSAIGVALPSIYVFYMKPAPAPAPLPAIPAGPSSGGGD